MKAIIGVQEAVLGSEIEKKKTLEYDTLVTLGPTPVFVLCFMPYVCVIRRYKNMQKMTKSLKGSMRLKESCKSVYKLLS